MIGLNRLAAVSLLAFFAISDAQANTLDWRSSRPGYGRS